jgi:predicted ribosomally synthesized peptide with SipW-like signal peptide
MKTTKKALLFTFCAVLLVVASVLGTMAYLTSSDTVTNTFTVGKVQIKLDEAKVKPDGSYETNHEQRTEGNTYHLLPGHEYYKDPTVTILASSEDAYVRAIVTVENIDKLKATFPVEKCKEYYGTDGVFLLQKLVSGWDSNVWVYNGYTQDGNNGKYEFRYTNSSVGKVNVDTPLPDLFESITIPGEDVTNENIDNLSNVKIVVEAHAIQADGFTDAADAWSKFKAN